MDLAERTTINLDTIMTALSTNINQEPPYLEFRIHMTAQIVSNPSRFLYEKVQEYEQQLKFMDDYSRSSRNKSTITGVQSGQQMTPEDAAKFQLLNYQLLMRNFLAERNALDYINQTFGQSLSEVSRDKLDYCIKLNKRLCDGYLNLIENAQK